MKDHNIPCIISDTLDEALEKIKLDKNDILLFSPMMASWDQYKSYTERGSKFREYIKKCSGKFYS